MAMGVLALVSERRIVFWRGGFTCAW